MTSFLYFFLYKIGKFGKMKFSHLEKVNKSICSNIFACVVFRNSFVDISAIGFVENLQRKMMKQAWKNAQPFLLHTISIERLTFN